MSSRSASKAAGAAADAQIGATDAQIAESQRQFDQIRALLQPYTDAGYRGLAGQQDLLGVNGAEAQQKAISAIESSPLMQALMQQGETAILQNASATGGLRGGNVQAALAQFRPQLLSKLIQQQYDNFGGLVNIGQNAAAGVGNAGQRSSSQIIDALGQQGASQAGAALAQGQAQAGMWNNIAGTASMLGTLKLLGKF